MASRSFAATVLLLCLAGRAWAADPAEEARAREAEALITRLAAAVEAHKKPDVERALPRLVKLHNELKSAPVRAKLLKAAAGVMSVEKLGAARMSAADALAKVNDPKAAWKELKRFLPSVKVKAAGPFQLLQCRTGILQLSKLGPYTIQAEAQGAGQGGLLEQELHHRSSLRQGPYLAPEGAHGRQALQQAAPDQRVDGRAAVASAGQAVGA